jgi:hypothetical protein
MSLSVALWRFQRIPVDNTCREVHAPDRTRTYDLNLRRVAL